MFIRLAVPLTKLEHPIRLETPFWRCVFLFDVMDAELLHVIDDVVRFQNARALEMLDNGNPSPGLYAMKDFHPVRLGDPHSCFIRGVLFLPWSMHHFLVSESEQLAQQVDVHSLGQRLYSLEN